MKIGMLVITFCLAAFTVPQAFAQDDEETWEPPTGLGPPDKNEETEKETDGDNDVPKKAPKPKVHSKVLVTYGAREALRFKLGKDAFIDAYVDQGAGTQDVPLQTSSAKFSGGLSAAFLVEGFTLTANIDILRNYTGIYGDWNGKYDKTYSFGVSRKIKLSPLWTITPSLKETRLVSDTATKEYSKTDLSLPVSYAFNKLWTIKAVTLAYSKQTYANRDEAQTDKTWTVSSGVAYKWSAKSTLDITINRQVRQSDQFSAEFLKTTVLPKYEYKLSPTSAVSMGIGYERHANSVEQFGRWILAPKVQLRWDL